LFSGFSALTVHMEPVSPGGPRRGTLFWPQPIVIATGFLRAPRAVSVFILYGLRGKAFPYCRSPGGSRQTPSSGDTPQRPNRARGSSEPTLAAEAAQGSRVLSGRAAHLLWPGGAATAGPQVRAHTAAPAVRRKGASLGGAASGAVLGAPPPAHFGASSAQLPPLRSVQPVPREAAPPFAPPVSPTGRVSARRFRCAETQAEGVRK